MHVVRSRHVAIDVGRRLVPIITQPTDSTFFGANEVVPLIASFNAGPHHTPDSLVRFRWEVLLKHGDHFHPISEENGNSTAITITNAGHAFSGKLTPHVGICDPTTDILTV